MVDDHSDGCPRVVRGTDGLALPRAEQRGASALHRLAHVSHPWEATQSSLHSTQSLASLQGAPVLEVACES